MPQKLHLKSVTAVHLYTYIVYPNSSCVDNETALDFRQYLKNRTPFHMKFSRNFVRNEIFRI